MTSNVEVERLAANAMAALQPELNKIRLLEIEIELRVAVTQMLPSDDQIICDHVRTALALVQKVRGV